MSQKSSVLQVMHSVQLVLNPDNAANADIVLGKQRHAVRTFDLRWVGAIAKHNDEVEEIGLGAGVLDDPASSIA